MQSVATGEEPFLDKRSEDSRGGVNIYLPTQGNILSKNFSHQDDFGIYSLSIRNYFGFLRKWSMFTGSQHLRHGSKHDPEARFQVFKLSCDLWDNLTSKFWCIYPTEVADRWSRNAKEKRRVIKAYWKW